MTESTQSETPERTVETIEHRRESDIEVGTSVITHAAFGGTEDGTTTIEGSQTARIVSAFDSYDTLVTSIRIAIEDLIPTQSADESHLTVFAEASRVDVFEPVATLDVADKDRNGTSGLEYHSDSAADTPLANGDPVAIEVQHPADETPTAIAIGTGFQTWTHLCKELRYAAQTGRVTRNIPPEAAANLESADQVTIFTPSVLFKVNGGLHS